MVHYAIISAIESYIWRQPRDEGAIYCQMRAFRVLTFDGMLRPRLLVDMMGILLVCNIVCMSNLYVLQQWYRGIAVTWLLLWWAIILFGEIRDIYREMEIMNVRYDCAQSANCAVYYWQIAWDNNSHLEYI